MEHQANMDLTGNDQPAYGALKERNQKGWMEAKKAYIGSTFEKSCCSYIRIRIHSIGISLRSSYRSTGTYMDIDINYMYIVFIYPHYALICMVIQCK